ncbi:MAG: type I restriction enzyme HsdR N-terminal domain-containing protein [Actinobacteria bacterium]|nr:type I restriction enzyme HsdR N-terminal domain-containing protein [Actinomycetota bacterium]
MGIKLTERSKSRLSMGMSKYSRLLTQAREVGANESDTAGLVNDILADVFGYEKIVEITTEQRIRGRFCDFAVKLNDKIRLIIEVKAIGIGLNDNHLSQAVDYAAKEGVEWVALTNGATWQVYHLRFEKPIDWDLVFSIDLLDKSKRPAEKIPLLYLLSKESFSKNEIADYWNEKLALSAKNVVSLLLSESMIEKLRRELRGLTGYRIGQDELRMLLKAQVFKASFDEVQASRVRKPRKKPVSIAKGSAELAKS